MRLSHVLALTGAIGALSGAVQAQPAATPLIVHDGNGIAQPLCEYKPDGTNLAGCTIEYGWNGTSFVLRPADAGGRPYVDVFSLPNVTLGAGGNTIGSIANTSFGAAQSGTWNVGLSAGGNVIGVVGNVQGSATAGQSGPLVQGAVTTGSPTYSTGQTNPLSLDANGNLRVNVVAGGGSGGTSSSYGSAFPASGTAMGAKNGANMVSLAADGSNNLLVNCAAGCSSSSSTFGAALPSGGQPVGFNVVSSAPTYAAGNLQAPTMDTSGNLRVSAAALPLPSGAATAANQTAVQSAPGTSATSAITVQGSASGVAVVTQDTADTGVAAGSAPTKARLGAAQYNSTPPTLTTGQTVAAQADANGNLKVNVVSGVYALNAIADLGSSGQLHTDLMALNSTAGSSIPAGTNAIGSVTVSNFPANQSVTCTSGCSGGGATSITSTNYVTSGVINLTTASVTQAIAAIASNYIYVNAIHCYNTGNYNATVNVLNSGSTVLDTTQIPAGGGWIENLYPAYVGGGTSMTLGTAISIQASVSTGTPSVSCVLVGYKAVS